MTDPRVNLRNPVLAAVLAWLIPGAGHFYQRRFFKAFSYSICILGVFFWGCSLGEAKVVQLRFDRASRPGQARQKTIGFLAQAGVGITAVPAMLQTWRYNSEPAGAETSGTPGAFVEELNVPFEGRLDHATKGRSEVTGRITGVIRKGQYGSGLELEGTFSGQVRDGDSIELTLSGSTNAESFAIGQKVTGLDDVTLTSSRDESPQPEFSGSRRRFAVRIIDKDGYSDLGRLEGTIPRSFTNHFLAPLDDEAQQHLSRKLGKYYELALVYTWIAGLLNLLAVWDAFQGPAYGYGDETSGSGDAEKPAGKAETTSNVAADAAKAGAPS